MLEVSTDENIKEIWSDLYGKITTITFMIYGDIGERDNIILNYAIKDCLDIDTFAQTYEEIDVETAKTFNLYQGVCIQWIFPDELEFKKEVEELISNGLDFHRLKHECIGVETNVYERTT